MRSIPCVIGKAWIIVASATALTACVANPPPPIVVASPENNATASPVEQPEQSDLSRCTIDMLSVTLGRAGGALGSIHMPIHFTNVSKKACTLFGFPGVSAWKNDRQVGVPADRDFSMQSTLVTVEPQQTISAGLRITNANNYWPKSRCQTTEATEIRVFPPNSSRATLVPYRFDACTNNLIFMMVRPVSAK